MEIRQYIGGLWSRGEGEPLRSYDPATGQVICQGRAANTEDVYNAISTARVALSSWALKSADQRYAYVEKFCQLMAEEKQAIAECISLEVGKPLWESLTEVDAVIKKAAISLDAYNFRTGVKESNLADMTAFTRHKPHGVMVVLGPFNFPAHLPNGHIVPALLAGNTIVFKPSEHAPLVAEKMLQCWDQAGLPAGVLNMVHGGKAVGADLTEQTIDGLLFTGSFATGQALKRLFIDRPEVILALEMGGNNPLIVHQVKDIEAAAYHTILSAFITAGQRCTCARRLIVPRGQEGDTFIACLVSMMKAICVGAYTHTPSPFMGPVINSQTAEYLLQRQDEMQKSGAECLLSMRILQANTGLITPGLIDTTDCDTMGDEEMFGPLLQLLRCDDLDAAIEIANDTKYGLSAGLFSDEKSNFEKVYTRINAGIINWNRQLTGALSSAPFGGIGKSGNHRASAYYAADYCAYPVASLESERLTMPETLVEGLIKRS